MGEAYNYYQTPDVKLTIWIFTVFLQNVTAVISLRRWRDFQVSLTISLGNKGSFEQMHAMQVFWLFICGGEMATSVVNIFLQKHKTLFSHIAHIAHIAVIYCWLRSLSKLQCALILEILTYNTSSNIAGLALTLTTQVWLKGEKSLMECHTFFFFYEL